MRGAVVAIYRVRGTILLVATALLLAIAFLGPLVRGGAAQQVKIVLVGVALAGWLVFGIVAVIGPRLLPVPEPELLHPPVSGRWLSMNSPATKVPSHGMRMYGQAYAIDLVHEPEPGARPVFGSGPAMRRNEEYPAFGQPVRAMADGVVVRASDWRRDHRARSTSAGVIYMMLEGIVREVGGAGFIVGNHVVIRTESGTYALVAHLKQGSARVGAGDRVRAGDIVGECGNSGNSSEPHVHAQLMDRSSPRTAQGLPMAFAGIRLDEQAAPVDALPRDEQHMTVDRADGTVGG